MNLCDKFLSMSKDARDRFSQVHKAELDNFLRYGTRLQIEDSEVITANKSEMISFGIKYSTIDKESFDKALEEHSSEAHFTASHVNTFFGSMRNFFNTVRLNIGIHFKGNLITDKEFLQEFSKIHVRSVKEYKKFLETPEGDGWPGYVTIYEHYGNFTLFLAAAMSNDLGFQFDMYFRMSLAKGSPLTMEECEEFNIELEMLHNIIGKENFETIIEEKIRQYKEGVDLGDSSYYNLEEFLDQYREMNPKHFRRSK